MEKTDYSYDDKLENEMTYEEEQEIEQTINLESFQTTSSYNIDMNVDFIMNYYKNDKFILDPEFQRRNVWDYNKKSKFIESIILNLPIPSILIADDKIRNKFIIIDGKQRISTIAEFFSPEKKGEGFKLKGLEVLKELNGYDYKRLSSDPGKMIYLSQLQTYPIRTTVVRNYDEKLLYFIFARLNSGSVPLSTQELRHTLYPGGFSKFINEKSKENVNIKKILDLKPNIVDKRMRDAELLCRFYAFNYYLNDYNKTVGNLLDLTYERINHEWEILENKVLEDLENFNKAIDFLYHQLGDKPFRVYFPDREEYGTFNRLMFDVLSTTFAKEEKRELVNSSELSLATFIKDLFIDNSDFLEAFKPVTSSKEKTMKRFEIFENKFNETFKNDKILWNLKNKHR